MDIRKLLAAGMMLMLMLPAFAQNKDAIVGKWESGHGSGQIQIYKTGDRYFGKIIWLKEPNDDSGQPKRDIYNPSDKLKTQPIVGLEILKNFAYKNSGTWDNGTVYNPKSGKSYSSKMWLTGNDKLNIRGYLGFSFMGKTEVWSRIP